MFTNTLRDFHYKLNCILDAISKEIKNLKDKTPSDKKSPLNEIYALEHMRNKWKAIAAEEKIDNFHKRLSQKLSKRSSKKPSNLATFGVSVSEITAGMFNTLNTLRLPQEKTISSTTSLSPYDDDFGDQDLDKYVENNKRPIVYEGVAQKYKVQLDQFIEDYEEYKKTQSSFQSSTVSLDLKNLKITSPSNKPHLLSLSNIVQPVEILKDIQDAKGLVDDLKTKTEVYRNYLLSKLLDSQDAQNSLFDAPGNSPLAIPNSSITFLKDNFITKRFDRDGTPQEEKNCDIFANLVDDLSKSTTFNNSSKNIPEPIKKIARQYCVVDSLLSKIIKDDISLNEKLEEFTRVFFKDKNTIEESDFFKDVNETFKKYKNHKKILALEMYSKELSTEVDRKKEISSEFDSMLKKISILTQEERAKAEESMSFLLKIATPNQVAKLLQYKEYLLNINYQFQEVFNNEEELLLVDSDQDDAPAESSEKFNVEEYRTNAFMAVLNRIIKNLDQENKEEQKSVQVILSVKGDTLNNITNDNFSLVLNKKILELHEQLFILENKNSFYEKHFLFKLFNSYYVNQCKRKTLKKNFLEALSRYINSAAPERHKQVLIEHYHALFQAGGIESETGKIVDAARALGKLPGELLKKDRSNCQSSP